MSKDVILGNVSTCKSSCAVSDMTHVMDRPCVRHTECNVCCRKLHVAPVRCLLAKAWRMSRISPGLRRFALGAGILHGTIDSPGYSRVLKATVIRVLQGASKRGWAHTGRVGTTRATARACRGCSATRRRRVRATSTASCCRSSSGARGKATLLRQAGAGNDVCTLWQPATTALPAPAMQHASGNVRQCTHGARQLAACNRPHMHNLNRVASVRNRVASVRGAGAAVARTAVMQR